MKEACEANLENLFSKLDLVLPGGNYYIHARDTRQQAGGGGGGGGAWLIRFSPTPQLSHHVIICSQLHS